MSDEHPAPLEDASEAVAILPAVDSDVPPKQRRKIAADWLLEGLFIVISVLLGFGVAQYGENRANRTLAERALTSLQAELEYNLAAVEPYVAFHRAYVDALAKVNAVDNGESGFQIYLKVRPALPPNSETDVPLPRRAAWDAAVSSGALRWIDYDLVAGLSEIYQMQEHLGAAVGRIPVSSPAFFDPANGNASVRLSQAALSEVTWAEQSLVALYRRQLPALRASIDD
jgi:hypothetical protein